jgi:hypothetical protein
MSTYAAQQAIVNHLDKYALATHPFVACCLRRPRAFTSTLLFCVRSNAPESMSVQLVVCNRPSEGEIMTYQRKHSPLASTVASLIAVSLTLRGWCLARSLIGC